MKKIDIDREYARLLELQSYGILDSPPEERFDKITRMATYLFDKETALISLVDAERQWFKSIQGNFVQVRETSRDISFCTHAIEQDDVFEIVDALLDERFHTNPIVMKGLRYYAGVPLKTKKGYNIGTLCLLDTKPGKLTQGQKQLLRDLASLVVEQMEVTKLNDSITSLVTRLEEQEQLLINKAKMQSVGELADDICHQVNNPLSIITGHVMILKGLLNSVHLQNKEEVFKELDIIDSTILRVSEVMKALRLYSNNTKPIEGKIKFSDVIRDLEILTSRKIDNLGINLKLNIQSDAKVLADKSELTHVLLNVLTNSIDALAEEDQVNKTIEIDLQDHEDKVYVTISNNGPSIPQEISSSVFRPFFTTKKRNFGLGLSMTKTYLEERGGEIVLENKRTLTSFKISLPKSA
jgi:two-component system NtrC family sensor kinase